MATPAEIIAAIDAAILDMLNGGGVQMLTFDGKQVTYTSLDQLRKARQFYASLDGTSDNNPKGLRISSIEYGEMI